MNEAGVVVEKSHDEGFSILGSIGRWLSFLPALKNPLPNPGKLEDYNVEARGALQNAEGFDGIKIDLNKTLSPVFMVSHHLNIAGSGEGYEFRTHYGSDKSLWMGKIDPSGALMAQIHNQATPNLLLRASAQMGNTLARSIGSVEAEYNGQDFFATGKAGNGEQYGVSYMQSITPHLSMGMASEFQGTVMGQDAFRSISMVAARYNTPKFVASVQALSLGALTASYARRVKDNTILATEFQMSPFTLDSVATIGAEVKGTTATYRGSINSQGQVLSFFEKKFAPEFGLQFSGELDNTSGKLKYGIGIVIGG